MNEDRETNDPSLNSQKHTVVDLHLLRKLAKLIRTIPVRFPLTAILLSVLLAAIGGYIYFFHLKIVTDRSRLINKDLKANRNYQHYLDEFGDDKYLVLVLSTNNFKANKSIPAVPNLQEREWMKKIAAAWANRLRERPVLFPKVLERIDWSEFDTLSLLYLSQETLQETVNFINKNLPVLQEWSNSPTLDQFFEILNNFLKLESIPEDDNKTALFLNGLKEFLDWLDKELDKDTSEIVDLQYMKNYFQPLLNQGGFDSDGYFFTGDGRLLTVFATVKANPNQQNQYAEAVEFAEKAMHHALNVKPDSIQIESGLAGLPALEYEEMKTTRRDFTRSTIIALFCVTLLFTFGFGNILRPALAAICLCIAIGITFGFVWLVIGHLNLLAMVFTVILVALGIDFAIHFVTHYDQALKAGYSPAQAIKNTYDTVGSALWMGGLTTGTAFLSAYFTEFKGLSELGIIAGTGLLICLICMFIIYPSILYILDTRYPRLQKSLRLRSISEILPVKVPFTKVKPGKFKLILISVIILISLGYFFGEYDFDTNLLNLQALDGKANRWQRLLLSTDDRTNFAITIFKDRQNLEKARGLFEAIPDQVRRTESLLPSNEAQKRKMLASVQNSLSKIRFSKQANSSIFKIKRQIWNIRQIIRKYRSSNAEARTALAELENSVDTLYRKLGRLPQKIALKRMDRIQKNMRQISTEITQEIKKYFTPPPFTLEQIPTQIKDRFLGKDSTLALLIYPSKNTWNRHNLEEFVEQTRQVDANIFGEIVALHENGQSLVSSFLHSATYSLIAILILLLIWSRSIRSTLFMLLPLFTSVGLLLVIMKWSSGSLSWNFANFFALPILIGVGVDSGIHLVKAWQQKSPAVFQGAAKAVLFSSMTTMIGFGILATSEHSGVGSLGLILFIGISICLLASLTLLPAVLSAFIKKDRNESSKEK